MVKHGKTNEQTLSDKIEIVGFHTDVIFKNKEGKQLKVPAKKGEKGLKVKDVKEFIKNVEDIVIDTTNNIPDAQVAKAELKLEIIKQVQALAGKELKKKKSRRSPTKRWRI